MKRLIMALAILACLTAVITTSLWAFDVGRAKNSTVLIAPEVGGLGSGICIDPRGYILTAAHVVDTWVQYGERCFVMFPDKPKWYTAELVYFEPYIDIALLRIHRAEACESIPLWSSRSTQMGDMLYTLGHPAGLTWLLSSGITSAVKYGAQSGAAWILCTPTAFFGNSGGALFNEDTEIVGIVQGMYAGWIIAMATDWLEEMMAGQIVCHEYRLARRAIVEAEQKSFEEENKDLIEEWKKKQEEAKKKAEEEREKGKKKKKASLGSYEKIALTSEEALKAYIFLRSLKPYVNYPESAEKQIVNGMNIRLVGWTFRDKYVAIIHFDLQGNPSLLSYEEDRSF